ncbi:MAG: hypothetical protein AB8F34_09060 [Akkermansiaceae bacterium]
MASEADSRDAEPTDEVGQPKSSILRRLFRMVCWSGLLMLLLYGLSNLWLWSSWGTATAEAQLKKRTGQDWEINCMSWSPWNGVTLYDVRMLQPEELREQLNNPVMVVEKLTVRPYWTQLAKGRLHPKRVEIDSPELTVSIEMIAAIASRTVAPKQQARAQTPTPKPPEKTEPKPADDKRVPEKPEKKTAPPVRPQDTPPKKRILPGLPVQIEIANARCKLVSVSKNLEILTVDGLDYSHSLLGEDAWGGIQIRRLQFLGMYEFSDLSHKIEWKRPYLEIQNDALEFGGVETRVIAQLGLAKSRIGRLPFLIDFTIDRQKIESASWLEKIAMVVSADSLLTRFRINGLLHKPDTWRADGLLTADKISIKESHGNHDVAFDKVNVPVILRQGVLRWADVRFISEDISIMGNGAVSLRDGHLSVTRIVASPMAAAMLTRGIRGSHLIDARSRWWYDLDTPDRKMRDLVVSGPLLEPQIDAGAKYASIPLAKMLVILYDFVREEIMEAGQTMKTLPARRQLNGAEPES